MPLLSPQTLNIVGPITLLLIAAILLFINYLKNRGDNKDEKAINVRRVSRRFDTKAQEMYTLLHKVPLISIYLENVRARLFAAHGLDEFTVRTETVKVLLKSLLFTLIIFVGAFILFDKTLYNAGLIGLISIIVFNTFLNNFIGNDDILLEQLPEAIEDLKHYFSSERTIEKAFIEAIKVIPYEVGLHFQRVLRIIQAPYEQGKAELRRYYEECPDRYLKILASYCFITSEYGDIRISATARSNGDSLFNRNMNHLISEIRNEYRKRRNVKMHLFGQKAFVMAPIFILPLLKRYILTFMNLPALDEFFTSSIGYIDMIVCTAVSVFCYIIFNGILKSNHTNRNVKMATRSWEDLFLKTKVLKSAIYKLMPKKNSKSYRKLTQKLTEAGSLQKLEWFYLKKAIAVSITLVILFSVVQVVHIISKGKIYEDIAYGIKDRLIYQNTLQMNTDKSEDEIRKMDRAVIEKLNILEGMEKRSEKEVKLYISVLMKIENVQLTSSVEMNTERIYKKYKALRSSKITLVEFLFILCIGWISYFIPNIRLNFSLRLQRLAMLDEVISYQTVILLLIFHRKATPEMVLEWLVWFSDIFYKPLNEAKNNYNDKKLGGVNALKKLHEEVSYKPLRQIIQNLTLAEEKLPLIEAFAELEQDQKFSSEIRKDNTEIIIQTKVALASRIASLSTGFTLIFYLVAPIVYSIVVMLGDMLKTIIQY